MGNYATSDQLIARYDNAEAVAHLTGNEESGVPDPTVLDEVITDAEGEMDSYFANRYLVPVSTTDAGVAARLKSLALDLALVKLERRQSTVSEAKNDAKTEAIEYLDKIAKGTILLPATATLTPTTSRQPVSSFGIASDDADTTKRLFTRDTQRNL